MATAFAGSLTRFYQRAAADPERVRAGVAAWCSDLRAAVATKVQEQLQWDEGADIAFTADLGDSGFLALRLLGLYADRSDLDWPDTVPALLELLPEWRAAAESKFASSRYGHLLACQVWLPGDFPVTMRVPLPDGQDGEVGSVMVLADQLRWLNQRTFQADATLLASWRELPAPSGAEFVTSARRGLGALTAAVEVAARQRVPLVVQLP